MTGKKPWYQSTTIQGLILLVATIAAGKMDWNFGEGEKAIATDLIVAVGEIIGSVMVLWGRLKAKDQITIKKAL